MSWRYRTAPGEDHPGDYLFYSLSWSPAENLDNSNITTPIFQAFTTTDLKLTVTTPDGCTGSDDLRLEVRPPDFLELTGDTSICPGDTARLHASGDDIVALVWRPHHYISDTSTYDRLVSPVTSTTYTVVAKDINSCYDSGIVEVVVNPAALINLPDSIKIYPGEPYQLDPAGNCLYFQWFPPLGLSNTAIADPVAAPEVNIRYFVLGTTESGCSIIDSIDIQVEYETIIDIPNAFTPGSSPNAMLKIVRMGKANLILYSIYNRWGPKIFETTNIDEGWDGTYNGKPQPMGIYIYSIEAIMPTGRKFSKQGNITLLR